MINYAYTKKSGKVEIDFAFFMELMQERANNDHARFECERELKNKRSILVYAEEILAILNRNLNVPMPFEPAEDDLADVDTGYQE